jgi:hypothetical protein
VRIKICRIVLSPCSQTNRVIFKNLTSLSHSPLSTPFSRNSSLKITKYITFINVKRIRIRGKIQGKEKIRERGCFKCIKYLASL